MNGEAYIIVDYRDKQFEKVTSKKFWEKIDDYSLSKISEKVSKFQNEVTDLHFEQEEHYTELFLDNPVEYRKGDMYFYKLKGDRSFFIAVLNVNKQRVYVMESVF